jgi:hypothetical protein
MKDSDFEKEEMLLLPHRSEGGGKQIEAMPEANITQG